MGALEVLAGPSTTGVGMLGASGLRLGPATGLGLAMGPSVVPDCATASEERERKAQKANSGRRAGGR